MRERLCITLARHAGETITKELAAAMVHEVCGPSGYEVAPMGLDERNERIDRLAAASKAGPPVDCPVREFFVPGFYVREITIPEGVCITGAMHRVENPAFLLKGSMCLLTETGPETIFAPRALVCRAGTKNAAVALEECVWINFFPTDETDPDKVVEAVSFSKRSELVGGADNAQAIGHAQLTRLEA